MAHLWLHPSGLLRTWVRKRLLVTSIIPRSKPGQGGPASPLTEATAFPRPGRARDARGGPRIDYSSRCSSLKTRWSSPKLGRHSRRGAPNRGLGACPYGLYASASLRPPVRPSSFLVALLGRVDGGCMGLDGTALKSTDCLPALVARVATGPRRAPRWALRARCASLRVAYHYSGPDGG